MRVSTAMIHQQGLQAIQRQQAQLTQTQLQLGSKVKWTSAAADPAAYAAAQGLDRAVAQNAQYKATAESAKGRLQLEEDVLTSVNSLLQQTRVLAIEAGSGGQSNESRAAIAKELGSIREQLLALANSSDGRGRYLFAGSADGEQPFSWNGGATNYAGDHHVSQVQIGAQRSIASGDSGQAVFMGLPGGYGGVGVSAATGNSGSLAVTYLKRDDGTAWDGGNYTLRFSAADRYEVLDTGGAVIDGGDYAAGQSLQVQGLTLTLAGTPAVGDELRLAPAPSQDVFALIDRLATAVAQLQAGGADAAHFQTQLQQSLAGLQGAENRMIDVRAGIGVRLNALDDAIDLSAAYGEHASSTVSTLRDLDYAKAATRLQLQMTALQAAQQSYTLVNQLSLFDYLR